MRAVLRLFAIIGLLLPIAALASNYSTEVLNWNTSSLVFYMRLTDAFGTTAPVDSGPNGLTGAVSGTVTFGSTSLVTGSADTSALWGSGGAISLGSAGQTYFHNWDYTQPMHFEAVIKPNLTRSVGVFEKGTIWCKCDSNSPFSGISVSVNYADHGGNYAYLTFALFSADGVQQYTIYGNTVDLQNGTVYHVAIDYNGGGVQSSTRLYVNGQDDGNVLVGNNMTHSIVNTILPYVGSQNGAVWPWKGNLQEVAVWNVSHPAGYQSGLSPSGNPSDLLAFYLSQLQQGGGTAPTALGSRPNLFWEDDLSTDIDGMADLRIAIYGHLVGWWNLRGVGVNSSDHYAASVMREVLNYWLLPNIPVYTCYGTCAGAINTTDYTNATATHFRPQDATNVGVTGVTIVTGGTLNQVGDVLPISGGTLASGFSAATVTVDTVVAGVITAAHISNSGSYSSAPSSPTTLPNLHSGTAATATFTTAAAYGNYTDLQYGLQQFLVNNSGTNIIVNTGYFQSDKQLVAGYSSLVSGELASLVINAGFWPTSTNPTYNPTSTTPEYNFSQDSSDASYTLANFPSGPTYLGCGIENSTPQNQANGFIYMGPASVANLADPVQYAFSVSGGPFVSGYLRTNWSVQCLLYAGFGVPHTGTTLQTALYWGATSGTATVNASTGANAFSLTSGVSSYLRRRASDSWYNNLMATIMAATPGSIGAGSGSGVGLMQGL
jgi:hypothetical protein